MLNTLQFIVKVIKYYCEVKLVRFAAHVYVQLLGYRSFLRNHHHAVLPTLPLPFSASPRYLLYLCPCIKLVTEGTQFLHIKFFRHSFNYPQFPYFSATSIPLEPATDLLVCST